MFAVRVVVVGMRMVVSGKRMVAAIPVRGTCRERRWQRPRRRVSHLVRVGRSRRVRLQASVTAVQKILNLGATHAALGSLGWGGMRRRQVVSRKACARVERRNALAARAKAVAARELGKHVRRLRRRSGCRSGCRAGSVRIELSGGASLARGAGRDRRLNGSHTERRQVVVRSGSSRRLHVRVRSVPVRAVVAQTRLVGGTFMRVVVVRRRVSVTVAVTRVVHWRAGTRGVGAVGHRVAAHQAHVAQGTKHGTAAGRPVGVAVRRVGRGARSRERQTRLGIVVERSGVLRLGGVVVTVQVIVGREARRVLHAAWDAGRSGSPSTGTVVGTVLVIAVEAWRRVAAVVGTVRGTRVATLSRVAIRRGSGKDGRGDTVVVLAVAVLVRASRWSAFGGRSGRRRVSVAARSVALVSICVRFRCVVGVVSVGRAGSTAFSLGTLKLVKLVAGEHGERRHFAVAGGTTTVPQFAIGIAVVALVVTNLPSERAVVDLVTWF